MKTLILTLLIVLIIAPVAFAQEKGYPVPDMSKAKLMLEENQVIKDKTPPTEVKIKTYKTRDGMLVRVYSVAGNIFRYDVSTTGEPPYEYRLIDKNGNGVFDTKEELIGSMVVKEKGEKYFIDLGPEPGKEYRYGYEGIPRPEIREQKKLLMGYPIYIPQWVLVRFRNP